jgi:uncharacterized protein
MQDILQNPVVIAGWILCVAVLILALLGVFLVIRRHRLLSLQYNAENRRLEEQIRTIQEKRKLEIGTSETWKGFANFVVVKKVKHGDSGICSFYLKPKDERLVLTPFLPGQHLTFQLPIGSQPIKRRYSLSESSNGKYYRISVKHAQAPRDKPHLPAGVGSSYFHDMVEDESESPYKCLIQVACPAGSFVLDPLDSKPLVLIGGGVGLTPMLSMFNSVLDQNPSREVWLFYGIRNASESILFDEGMLHPSFEELMKERSNIHVWVYYSGVDPKDDISAIKVPHGVKQSSGRVSVEALRQQLPSNNYLFYICGPDAMMNDLEEKLAGWGVPEDDILTERFAPPSPKAVKHSEGGPRKITFAKSGKEIEFTAEDSTILEVAERAGVPIAYDCRAGSCGTCKVGLVSGKVAEAFRTNHKCAPGSCLACANLPETDLVLDC